MKLFKSSILAILGLVIGLTSCSDDKYVVGESSPGAYFAQGTLTTINISPTGSSFTVPLMRTADGALSYTLSSMDVSGLFSIPTSVNFDANSNITDIVITYDNTKLELGQPYEISLAVDGNSHYGGSTINLTVTMQLDMETESFGEGTFDYGSTVLAQIVGSSLDPGLPMMKSYMPSTPDENVYYTIQHWALDTDLNIIMPDANDVASDGTITVMVPSQETGYSDEDGRLNICDAYNFYKMFGMDANAEKVKDNSYFDPESGTFYLYVFYHLPDYVDEDGQGGYAYGSFGYQTFQLDGYPDNSITVTYDGLFTNRDQEMTAKATITCGADVAKVGAVMVEGDDIDSALDTILGGGQGVQQYDGAALISADFEVTTGGQYSIVAVSYDSTGEAVMYDYDTFDIMIGVDPSATEWKDLGLADYADGWVIAAYSMDGVPLEPLEWAYSVPVQQYVGDNEVEGTMYRLVNPYGDEHPLTDAGYNAYKAKRNIQFNILGSYVGILPQPCGYGAANWGGEMTIGNVEGMYMDERGWTLQETATALKNSANASLITVYEDETVEVVLPIWALPLYDNEFGYNWSDYKASYIFMPDASDAVRAKVRSAKVAKPSMQGAIRMTAKPGKVAKNIKNVKKAPRRITSQTRIAPSLRR